MTAPTTPTRRLTADQVFTLRREYPFSPPFANLEATARRDGPTVGGLNTAKWSAIRELAKRDHATHSLLGFIQYMTPYPYLAGWFHRDLCTLLTEFMHAVDRKESPRLLLAVPPGAGKSEIASRYFPPFLLGHHPNWEIMTATYGQDLSDKFGRIVRDVLNDPRFQELFPAIAMDRRTNSASYIATHQRGNYNATSVGGSITGQRAHCLIIDDPIKGREDAESQTIRDKAWDWYLSDARSRLYPGGGVIVIQTRWHTDDLMGRLLEAEKAGGEKWTKVFYEAIATSDEPHRLAGQPLHPERYNLKELNQIKRNLFAAGKERDWFSLYQQNPVAPSGNFFKRDQLHTVPPSSIPSTGVTKYLTMDLAVTTNESADYSCVWPFGIDSKREIWFTPDAFHGRLDASELCDLILARARTHKVQGVLIEKGPITRTFLPFLRDRMLHTGQMFEIIEVPTIRADKRSKAQPIHGMCANQWVHFPATEFMIETAIPELLAFDSGKHDDIVDTIALPGLVLDQLIAGRGDPHARQTPGQHERSDGNTWTYDDMRARTLPPIANPGEGVITGSRQPLLKLNGRKRAKRATRY